MFAGVVGWACYILGEEAGWEAGFIEALDLKEAEEDERRIRGNEPSTTGR